ncbi:hypothetical protein RINTHM_2040 [Richelia intracellularis HM01]|nr:hypothetical protein RINTHM_2040 [Richelia intracellularis HM01]
MVAESDRSCCFPNRIMAFDRQSINNWVLFNDSKLACG